MLEDEAKLKIKIKIKGDANIILEGKKNLEGTNL
jgi:hypothetical protein